MNRDYLKHYGIKGQKWGVRRYQNADGTLTSAGKNRLKGARMKSDLVREQLGIDIPKKKFVTPIHDDTSKDLVVTKDKTVTHVTPNDFRSLREGQDLYISATETDKNIYKSYLTLMLKHKGFGLDSPIKEIEFSLKEDLKSPSNKRQKKIFEETYKKNQDVFERDLQDYYSKHKNKPSDKYDAFIKSLDGKGESKSIFYQAMKDQGYNAVLDQHDVNESWMAAKRPLIVMDALNTLGDMKVKDISNDDIVDSLKKLGVMK